MAFRSDDANPQVTKTSLVAAPINEVFAMISDPRRAPEWNPLVQGVDADEDARLGLGMVAHWRTSIVGVPFGGIHEITEFEEPSSVEVRCRESRTGVPLRCRFTLESVQGGTSVTAALSIGLPSMFEPFISKAMMEGLERALGNVAPALERARQ